MDTAKHQTVVTKHRQLSRPLALRSGLPYGAVMATAGASILAVRCGLHALAAPILILAVAQAIWIGLAGAWRHRNELQGPFSQWTAIGPTSEHSGIHTVPLGIAMIAGALHIYTGPDGALASIAWLPLAVLALALLTTLLCVGRFTLALFLHSWNLQDVDGTWFLAPAASLGTALATVVMADRAIRWPTMLAALLFATSAIGWCGYWVVAVVAALRIKRYRLRGKSLAPWWIAMGCAGLAAATLGSLLDARALWTASFKTALSIAMATTIVVALVLLVPVIAASIHFLLRRCRFRNAARWSPTFSTAVFALGCLATGRHLNSEPFQLLGLWAGLATLALWAVTMIWNGAKFVRHRP